MHKNKRGKYFIWLIAPISFGVFLGYISTTNFTLDLNTQKNQAANAWQSIRQEEDATKNSAENFYFIKDINKKPKVGAESYLVGDLDTGEIILEKNKDKILPIASISKLMTALVSKEMQNQEEKAIVSKRALSTFGENGNFKLNEKIKISDLIYPLLLESSNDAAEIIAENSNRNSFIKKMNEKAKDLKLKNTSFQDPSGLSEKNTSTSYDLFKFSQYLKENSLDLLQISKLKSYKNTNHVWFNNSQFLSLLGYQGGKRGYIDESLQTAVSLFTLPLSSTGNRNIGIVVLRSQDRYKDMKNILEYLKKNVYYGGALDADMDWVKNKNGILDENEPNFVTLLFGGDIMLDRGVKNSINKNSNGDYSLLFEKLNILKEVDITFANLEGPASDQGKDGKNLYSFRMEPSTIPALKGAGFTILSIANNHIGDWGKIAFLDTLARLKENEILYTGGGLNINEAEKPTIIEKNGMKIGFLAFSDVGPNFMETTIDQPGILLVNNLRFEEIIKNASKEVDYLVTSIHFGEEYQKKHNKRQEELAHKAIDAGAKIVVGHQPHIIQDTEVYKNGYIAYSLGNLIFDQGFSEDTMKGLLLQIKLNKDGTMLVQKNTVKLNKIFQPDKITKGKEEKIKFQTIKN